MKSIYLGRIKGKMLREINFREEPKNLREYKEEFNRKNEYPFECSYLIKIEWKDYEYNAWLSNFVILPVKPTKEFIKGLKQTYEYSHITCYPLRKVEFSYDYQESIIVG